MEYKIGDNVVHDGFHAELVCHIGKGYWVVDTKTWGYDRWHEEDFRNKESEVVCDICDGKGYLTDVYDTEAEETQIQRCDSCKEFVSDKQAQEHVESEVA